MEIPNAVAIAGIIVSLAIFCLLLCRAASGQRRSRADYGNLFPPPPNRSFGQSCPRLEGVWSASTDPSDIKLIAISHDPECRAQLKEMAEFYCWNLFLCTNCWDAESVLATERIPIVICDRDTLDISWRDAFRIFLASDRSRCVVLCSKADDDCFWQEVIRCGGYDVVPKPLREEKVVQTVNFAWSFWRTVHCRSTVNRNISTAQTSAKAI
jgi:hypothetical protein